MRSHWGIRTASEGDAAISAAAGSAAAGCVVDDAKGDTLLVARHSGD